MSATLFSCNHAKYLSEGEVLYAGAEVKFETPGNVEKESMLRDEIDEVLRPEPNKKMLGLRPALWIHNIAWDTDKEKGFKYWLKYKVGKPPVLLSTARPESVSRLIQNRLYNNGYFNATVDFNVKEKKSKTAKIIYTATIERPYRLDTITFSSDTTQVGREIKATEPNTLLKRDAAYKLQEFQDERERIDGALKEIGYFYFSGDMLQFSADTTVGNKSMNIWVARKPQMPHEAGKVFRLGEIDVYPNYTLTGEPDSADLRMIPFDDLRFFWDSTGQYFRAKALKRSIFLKPGNAYARSNHTMTLNRLMGMNAFKFADVRFTRDEETDDILNVSVFMTPMDKKTLRAELEMVSKSNNFTGPRLEGTWTNRNTFGGAEMLRITLHGGVESQLGGVSEGTSSGDFLSYQVGANVSLNVPRFITPFNIRYNSDFVPNTVFRIGYELVNRTQYFMLNSFNTAAGYRWKPEIRIQHELNPISATFAQLTNTSEAFDNLLNENPFLRNSFAEQFILGPEYKFVYNDQMVEEKNNHIFYSGGIDLSNPAGMLGLVFSQYIRHISDFRYYFKINKSSKLVSRVYAGVGVPYGPSDQLPYVKQFFAGGPNGIRAFRARTIGPGTFRTDTEQASGFLDQNGDLRLEFNLEYRFDIYGFLKGALFADAGNIWLLNDNPQQPGAAFNAETFLSELAIGVGAGVRMDFSFFILRLDLALPIRKPWLEENNGWVPDWRRERPVLNIGIGYPF